MASYLEKIIKTTLKDYNGDQPISEVTHAIRSDVAKYIEHLIDSGVIEAQSSGSLKLKPGTKLLTINNNATTRGAFLQPYIVRAIRAAEQKDGKAAYYAVLDFLDNGIMDVSTLRGHISNLLVKKGYISYDYEGFPRAVRASARKKTSSPKTISTQKASPSFKSPRPMSTRRSSPTRRMISPARERSTKRTPTKG